MPNSQREIDLATLFDEDWASGKSSLEATLKRLVDVSVGWFQAGAATLFLRSDPIDSYYLAAQAGPDARVPANTVLHAGEGIAGKAIRKGAPVLISESLSDSGVGSSIIVPLVVPESGCVGVLNVSRPASAPLLSKDDLRKAKAVARYIALAVNNARLFTRLNQAVDHSRAMSAKLDAIIANLGVGVLVVSEHLEVTGWNPEAGTALGCSIGPGSYLDNLLKHVPLALRVAVDKTYAAALRGERSGQRAQDTESERAWMVVASPLPGHDVTIAIQDVTEHEHAQRELSRLNRLAEIGQMTAAVAHEIRNPLTGIRSASQMVQGLGDEACEIGKIIEEEALKLNALCDQFLEFARPLQLSQRELKASDVVRQVADRHRADFELAGVHLELSFPNFEPTIVVDPLRLEQVLRNLLLNALQACQSGDTVTVVVGKSALAVSDTGKGMDKRGMDRLFVPFFTTKPNGTGLGLPTVRKIADAHGWGVQVESEPDHGTTFVITFGMEKAA